MATTRLTISPVARRVRPDLSGPRSIAVGLAPLLVLYILYTIVRFLVSDRGPIVGGRHATWVTDLERWLGIDWELGIHRFTLERHWLTTAANWYYVFGFFPVLVAGAVLAAWRAPAVFAWWRGAFAVSLALALIGFAVFPLTPPRLLGEGSGYVDTLMLYGPRYYGDATGSSLFNAYGSIPSTVNVYAAMPSMHVAWSVVAAILLGAALRGRWWAKGLAVAHPTLMAFAVVATANHYLLDVVGGLAVLATAMAVARWWNRRGAARPAAAVGGPA